VANGKVLLAEMRLEGLVENGEVTNSM